jgi:hypothetical protein
VFSQAGLRQDETIFSAKEIVSIIIGNTEMTLDLGSIFSDSRPV